MKYLFLLGEIAYKGNGNQYFQIVYILILCVVIFVGAYYSSRLLGNYQLKRTKLSNLKIVEVISVGPQKTIQLVKVGNDYVLIGVTKDRITFMKEVSADHIDLSILQSVTNESLPFSHHMDKYLKKKSSKKNGD
ncbi:MAG: hypothetical protein CVU84_02655 [Firmicutes bacterium HGW-Firmicutes-1]|jgi:flagellar protein FliO/FliZ|nr:MAG: hypothetical protein CVU84_02655 [Firmicutes bacterium HGW-Firmicutes-1]